MSLLEELQNKIDELNEKCFSKELEYSFYEFVAQQIARDKSLSEINNFEYILALVGIQSTMPFEELYEAFLPAEDYLLETMNNEDFICFLNAFYALKKVNLLNQVLELEYEPTMGELKNVGKDYDPKKDGIITGTKSPELEVNLCLIGYKTIGQDMIENFEQLQTFARALNTGKPIDDDFEKYLNYKRLYKDISRIKKHNSKKYEVRVVYDDNSVGNINEVIEYTDINDTLRKISNRYYNLSKEREEFYKKINRQIVVYKKMLELLSNLDKGKQLIISDDISIELEEQEVLFKFFQTVLEHNRKIYSCLELENIRKDNYHQIEKLLFENEYYVDELPDSEKEKLFKCGNITTLEKIIPYLKEEFSWLNVTHLNYVQILLNTSSEILDNIIKLIRSNLITKEFVYTHIGILLDSIKISVNDNDILPLYSLFNKNLSLLKNNLSQLSFKIKKNEEILFGNSEKLMINLLLCQKYELNLNSENAKMYDLNILIDSSNFDDLDQFIELGYAEYIKQNPQLLKRDSKDILVRLSIMKNIGLDPINDKNRIKGSITNGKNFYVGQELLNTYRLTTVDEYTPNDDFDILRENSRTTISTTTESLDIVSYLDRKFKKSELEYQINDTIISRNKVLRNLECLIQNKDEYDDSSIALSAIIYHSVIDNNTIEFIKEELSKYKKESEKKKTYHI